MGGQSSLDDTDYGWLGGCQQTHQCNGYDIKTTLTKVDVKALLDTVVAARDIKNPEIILGADGDTEKCIITCIIKDENYESNDEDINF